MKEQIINILADFNSQIERAEKQITDLEEKVRFCKEHFFEEEERIARVKLDAIDMTVYRWRKMYDEIKDVVK